MLWILVLFLGVICFFADKKFLKNKDLFLPIYLIIIFIILMGGQLSNPDFEIYNNIFLRNFYDKDPGFGCILAFLKFLGFGQNNFRIGIAILGLFLISFTVFKYTNKRTAFYLLYFLYPFFFDIVQLRNFLVMSILIFSIQLLTNKNFKNNLLYVILIFLAFTIQKIAIVYLPLLFIDNISIKNNKKHFFTLIILISIVVGLNKNILLLIVNNFLLPLSSNIEGLENYTQVNTNMGWIIFWCEQIFSYLLVKYIYNSYKNKLECNMENNSKLKFIGVIKDINFYMFIFLPLFILDENYIRIIRNIVPLNIITFCIYIDLSYKEMVIMKDNIKKVMALFIYQLTMFLLFYRTYAEYIFISTFQQNWIIQVLTEWLK